uniref:Uncharacterized protein n=1 Tax=Arundo donax TaxID=35708 RepID=A0A0A9EMD3_ARUDO
MSHIRHAVVMSFPVTGRVRLLSLSWSPSAGPHRCRRASSGVSEGSRSEPRHPSSS